MIFDLASYSPAGSHWAISASEAASLGRYTVAAIDSISPSAKARFSRVAEKNLPWIALAVTGAVITIPRVMVTRAMMEAQKNQNAQPVQGGEQTSVTQGPNSPNPTGGTRENERTSPAKNVLGAGATIIDGGWDSQASEFVPRSSGKFV